MEIALARCLLFTATCWVAQIGNESAFEACGPLQGAYGPFDFLGGQGLTKHGIPAMVFVSTGVLGGGRMWNDTVIEAIRGTGRPSLAPSFLRGAVLAMGTIAEQLRMLPGFGIDVGVHMITHPILAQLEDADAAREIGQGKRDLQAIVGRPVPLFAYPNG